MSPFDGDSNTIGIQYCPGYVDKSGQWRAGFYCPPKSQGRKMYCCGSTVHKYCCGSKEENELFGSNVSYISSSTMFTVTIVTFIFAVMLTVLGFVCCRKFFKRHLGGLEIEETHSYRMSAGHGDVNQETNCVGSTILTNSSVPIQPSATTTSINLFDLTETSSASPYANLISPSTQLITANGTRLDSYLPTISSYINPPTVGFIDPPPPYQVTPNYYSDHNNINNNINNNSNNNSVHNNNSVNNQNSQQHQQPLITANNNHNVNSFTNNNVNTHNDRTSNNNRILSMLGASYRRDIIHPCEGQKRLWRTMSQ